MTDKTRAQLIDELAASQQEVSRLLASTAAIQDWQREPAEWSFRYLAAHLAAVERERNLPRIHPAVGEITLLDALDELHDQDLGHARHIRQLIEDYLEDSN
jgi:hypothetical protein